MVGYLYGGNTGVKTAAELQREREIVDALIARGQRPPQNLGEGLSTLGQAIASRMRRKRLEKDEGLAKEAGSGMLADLFGPTPDSPTIAPEPEIQTGPLGGSMSSYQPEPSLAGSAYPTSGPETPPGPADWQQGDMAQAIPEPMPTAQTSFPKTTNNLESMSADQLTRFMADPRFEHIPPIVQQMVTKRYEMLTEPQKPTSDIINFEYGLKNPGFAKSQMAGGDNDMYGTGYWDAKNKRYVFPSKSGQWVAPEGLEPGAELQDPATRAAAIAGGKLTGGAAEPVINEYVKNVRPAMQNASHAIKTIHEARKVFDSGIATGNDAEIMQSARGWARAMGFEVDASVLSNTQAFQNFIGQIVIPRMKELGGNDSNEELRKLYELSGGDITKSPEAIKLTLDLTEKLMRDKLRMGREYERITTGILPMSPVEEPPEYVIENMAPSGGPAATLPQAIPDASDPLGLRPKR